MRRTNQPSLFNILKAQGNVLVALMLRDVRTRFGSAPAFLLAVIWPLSHILLLVWLNLVAERAVPYGDSAAIWFATGVVPFMVFSYMSRIIGLGTVINRPLLIFPALRITDIVFSRAIIEILVSALVIISLFAILALFDVSFLPNKIDEAFYALGSAILVGLGYGICGAMIAMIFHQWVTIYALITILLWMTSGVFFVPSSLPEELRFWLYFHPIVHCIEWMRTAYYDGYQSLVLDKRYVLAVGFWTIFIGLFIERFMRGRLLMT